MKFFNLLFLLLIINVHSFAQAQDITYPPASGYVVDQSGIIDAATQARITDWILELKQKTTAEVAVVTVDSTGPLSIEEYAVNLFKRFGIGQKGKDNGVLVLVAYKDHHMRIEVGYGLEGAITDAKSSGIINGIMRPDFKAGNYSQGIEYATAAIVSLIAKEYNVTLTGVPQAVIQEDTNSSSWFYLLVFCIFISIILNRGGMFIPIGGFSGGYSRGGYGGGGGFSGGFGGFGGGGSGGGGASGGW